jgi:hypothetical protein
MEMRIQGLAHRRTIRLAGTLLLRPVRKTASGSGIWAVQLKAGPQFGLLKKNEMSDPIMATPAISGGSLFVRKQHHLWAIRTTR